MTKRRFNDIRARLLMRFKSHGSFEPRDEVEEFVAEIIEAKHELDKRVEEYARERDYNSTKSHSCFRAV